MPGIAFRSPGQSLSVRRQLGEMRARRGKDLAMGTWEPSIETDDVFADVYALFWAHYNSGAPADIAAAEVKQDLAESFEDDDDRYAAHYALALARWETRSLEPELLTKVADFIETGADLRNWADRNGSEDDLAARGTALAAFLEKIRTPRPTKKRRTRGKYPEFREVDLVKVAAPDGLKTLRISESYSDNVYTNTMGIVEWARGGGAIFHFKKLGVGATARWIDAQSLEICLKGLSRDDLRYGEGKETSIYFDGDNVSLLYIFDTE